MNAEEGSNYKVGNWVTYCQRNGSANLGVIVSVMQKHLIINVIEKGRNVNKKVLKSSCYSK